MKIDAHDLAHCLQAAWNNAPESGRKSMNCLRKVYKYAFAHGFDVDITEIEKSETLLGPRMKSQKNMPAMHWKDVPAFYSSLNDISIDHLALRLLILTGLRTDPIRHLQLDQIEGDVWTVPEDHVKGRVGHAKRSGCRWVQKHWLSLNWRNVMSGMASCSPIRKVKR